MAMGLPIALVSIIMLCQMLKDVRTMHENRFSNGRLFAIASLLTWTLLWLSGKNMGEAARLWCFVTPWWVIIAAQTRCSNFGETNKNWQWLLVAQLIVATVTVGRVSGFLEF